MDILSLPDAFLRRLVNSMKVKDRLSLSHTCRAFEELVAESDSLFFNRGHFIVRENGVVLIYFGPERLKFSKEQKRVKFQDILPRLSRGITIWRFTVMLDDIDTPLDFLHSFMEKVVIEELLFEVKSESQLELSLRLIAAFPTIPRNMNINFHPQTERFLSLLPSRSVTISPENNAFEISSVSFFKMLYIHKKLNLENSYDITLTSHEWMKAMQIISIDCRQREVKFRMKSSTIVNCLADYGITEQSRRGDFCGEFEIISAFPQGPENYASMHFRYEDCFIRVAGIQWREGDCVAGVTMENEGDVNHNYRVFVR